MHHTPEGKHTQKTQQKYIIPVWTLSSRFNNYSNNYYYHHWLTWKWNTDTYTYACTQISISFAEIIALSRRGWWDSKRAGGDMTAQNDLNISVLVASTVLQVYVTFVGFQIPIFFKCFIVWCFWHWRFTLEFIHRFKNMHCSHAGMHRVFYSCRFLHGWCRCQL